MVIHSHWLEERGEHCGSNQRSRRGLWGRKKKKKKKTHKLDLSIFSSSSFFWWGKGREANYAIGTRKDGGGGGGGERDIFVSDQHFATAVFIGEQEV